ncbi:FG-GAP repeat domain-containing protein [Vibrio harveyi]|uniref:FG-GAP repeat domain-containing protein n=1 Tax=Vibrio harveyi TaxID=669 RepID=UPI003CF134D7
MFKIKTVKLALTALALIGISAQSEARRQYPLELTHKDNFQRYELTKLPEITFENDPDVFFPSTAKNALSFEGSDLNSDGLEDLLYVDEDGYINIAYRESERAFHPAIRFMLDDGEVPRNLLAIDLDLDRNQKQELVYINQYNQVRFLTPSASGYQTSSAPLLPEDVYAQKIDFADFDEDGYPELAILDMDGVLKAIQVGKWHSIHDGLTTNTIELPDQWNVVRVDYIYEHISPGGVVIVGDEQGTDYYWADDRDNGVPTGLLQDNQIVPNHINKTRIQSVKVF